MNVFVLTTGRSGTVTFWKACEHMTNYTSAHESRRKLILMERLNFPDNHIEIDGRLAFYLGQLDKIYGDEAYYVHLRRGLDATIESCLPMYGFGTLKAWQRYIVITGAEPRLVIRDFLVNRIANIEMFLKDKTHVLDFQLETAKEQWQIFWDWIGAKGDYQKSLAEWNVRHNSREERAIMYPKERPPDGI